MRISKKEYVDMQVQVLIGSVANSGKFSSGSAKVAKEQVDELLKLNNVEVIPEGQLPEPTPMPSGNSSKPRTGKFL